MFDTELSLLTLLTNIMEAEANTIKQQSASESCRLKSDILITSPILVSITHFPVVKEAIDSINCGTKRNFVEDLLSFRHTAKETTHHSKSRLHRYTEGTVVDLLLGILHYETQSFIDDLYATDDAINNNSGPSDAAPGESLADALPVAELIIASFTSLLLFVISRTQGRTRDRGVIRSSLPGGTWWLCIRVLKAFLSLQGQVKKPLPYFSSSETSYVTNPLFFRRYF